MDVTDTSEHNYWKAYCNIIKSSITPALGKDSALFYCAETVRCIPAADWIPQEVTNLGVFFLADSLLNSNNPFYLPSRSNGYIKSLQTYLGWVDIGGSNDQGVIARYKDALQLLESARKGVSTALENARQEWEQRTKAGLTTSDFATWAASGAASYNRAEKAYQSAAAQANKAAQEMNGQLAAQFNMDSNLIDQALYSQVPIPGITMGVTDVDANRLWDQLNDELQGKEQKLEPATAVYQKGSYSISGYKATLQNWYRNYHSYRKDPQRKQVDLETGKSLSIADVGITQTSGSAFTWPSFISFGTRFDKEDKRETMKVENENYKIQVTLTYGDMKAFTINPGKWDIGNPRSTYPNLLPGAPSQVKDLVRPLQILCGTAIGLEMTFSGGAEKQFDELHEQYESLEGGVRIFGFNVSLARNTSDISATHSGSWDRTNGRFVVKPVDGAGWCTLLGVLGEKLPTDNVEN